MIQDARLLPIDSPIDADITIIGGGAAGIAMALAFAGGPLRIVVLESGGLDYERQTQALYRGKISGTRYEPLDLCRVRMFGGSTDKRGWAGWCKIFDDSVFEARDWVQHSGWPIAKSALAPFYRDALRTMSLPSDVEELAAVEARGGNCLPLAGVDCVNDPVAVSGAPHLAQTWLAKLKAADNVRVILHANVTEIETDQAGRVVKSLRFATLDRRVFRMAPGFTVIAAGGIEAARLLLASNQTVKTGLGNQFDWVGRCFMDHPRYAWGQIASLNDSDRLLRYNPTLGVGQRRANRERPWDKPLFGFGIALSWEAQMRERVLGSRTWIVPVSAQGERRAGRELREMVLWTLLRGRMPEDALMRGKLILADLPNAASAALAHLRSVAGSMTRWQFVTILEPEPNPDSRVSLDVEGEPDALGMPRVRLDWRLTPLVTRTLEVTQRLIVADLRALGVECFIEGAGGPRANQAHEEPRWVWHHMGTTRMSSDPRQGVVDEHCRVHGMDNLYVVGSSVFPTCSTDMPTLTLIALAHRAAAHLRERWLNGQAGVEVRNAPTLAPLSLAMT